MTQFTIIVGLNDKDTKMQKVSTLEAFKMATNLCTSYTDGATIYEADGVYKHDNGTVVVEKSLKIDLLFIERDTVVLIANQLKRMLNQESVVLMQTEVMSDLI